MQTSDLPVIDANKCTGTAWCVWVCPTDALDFWNDLPWLKYPNRCASCAACVLACPVEAISIASYDRRSGQGAAGSGRHDTDC